MEYVKKVINGFLSGVGFTSGLILILFLANGSGILKSSSTALNKQASNSEELENKASLKKLEAIEKLVILDRGTNLGLRGPEYMYTVKNHSDYKFTWIFPKVELFDKNGVFIYKCEGSSINTLKPKDSKNVKTSCSGANRSIVENIGSYLIKIDDAN